jgi:crossover junction endodeoxyribonuclease RuvC
MAGLAPAGLKPDPVVLGIDPALRICGWGVVRGGARPQYIASGAIRPKTTDTIERRLLAINQAIATLLDMYQVDEMAIEDPFIGALAPASALAIGQARAAALIAAAGSGVEAELYAPKAVKASVSGYGAGDKQQVQAMVKLLLSMEVAPEPLDASDALAVAICHLSQRKLRALEKATK